MIYTLTLAPSLDYQLTFDGLRLGQLNRAQRADFQVGGKGVNVSVMLGRLGRESVCLGLTAGFVGDEIERRLDAMAVRHDFIRLAEGCSRVNVKVLGAAETELNAASPTVLAADAERLRERLLRLESGDTLILSGSLPGGLPDTFYRDAAQAAILRGVRVMLDASGSALRQACGLKLYLVKPNIFELEELAGRRLNQQADIVAEALKLRDAGAEYVLVSLGGDGALMACASGVYQCGVPKGQPVSTTGAGDSMVAALAAAADAGQPDGERLRFAVACGSATAYSRGLADRETVMRLLAQLPPIRRVR